MTKLCVEDRISKRRSNILPLGSRQESHRWFWIELTNMCIQIRFILYLNTFQSAHVYSRIISWESSRSETMESPCVCVRSLTHFNFFFSLSKLPRVHRCIGKNHHDIILFKQPSRSRRFKLQCKRSVYANLPCEAESLYNREFIDSLLC